MLFELPDFRHLDAKDVHEALFWLQRYGDKATVVAGATDLLNLMKDRVEGPKMKTPQILINIKTIQDMNQIFYNKEEGLRIGAAVTLNRLIINDVVKESFNILAEAAQQVGTTQIRNMGTIGGNICQRPRCLYFRHPHFICFKKGGPKCYAITGEHRYYHSIIENGRCTMAHPSDMAPALIALRTKVILTSLDGEREIPLQDFFLGPNTLRETALNPSELITEFLIPNQNGMSYQVFMKHRIRHAVDFALSSIATIAQMSNGICWDIQIVLGGVAPFPYIAKMAEEVVRGKSLNKELIDQASEASVVSAHALSQNKYKVDLTKALVQKALMSIWIKSTDSQQKVF